MSNINTIQSNSTRGKRAENALSKQVNRQAEFYATVDFTIGCTGGGMLKGSRLVLIQGHDTIEDIIQSARRALKQEGELSSDESYKVTSMLLKIGNTFQTIVKY